MCVCGVNFLLTFVLFQNKTIMIIISILLHLYFCVCSFVVGTVVLLLIVHCKPIFGVSTFGLVTMHSKVFAELAPVCSYY